MQTLCNTPAGRTEELFRLLHQDRRFFPTDRQRELYRAFSAVPPKSASKQADRLHLLGYGGA